MQSKALLWAKCRVARKKYISNETNYKSMIDHFAEKEEETCLNIDVNPFLYVYAFYLCDFGKP